MPPSPSQWGVSSSDGEAASVAGVLVASLSDL